MSGGCSSAPRRSATSSHLKMQHAGQGSNLSLPVLETGVPPLELPAHGRCLLADNAQGGTRTPVGRQGHQLYRLMQSPLCHLRAKTVSVEGFEPSAPCTRSTCAAKLRHTLKDNAEC